MTDAPPQNGNTYVLDPIAANSERLIIHHHIVPPTVQETVKYVTVTKDAEYEARIRALTAEVAAARATSGSSSHWDEEISYLQSAARSRRGRIIELERELAETQLLSARGVSSENEMRTLHQEITSKDKVVDQLHEELVIASRPKFDAAPYERQILDLENELTVLEREPQVDVSPYERQIRQLNDEKSVNQETIQKLETELDLLMSQLAAQQKSKAAMVALPAPAKKEPAPLPPPPPPPPARDLNGCNPFIGFGLLETTHQQKKGYLTIETMYEHGPAWNAGLRLGDRVYAVGPTNEPINTLAQVQHTMRQEAKIGQSLRVVHARENDPERRIETFIKVKTSAAKARNYDDIYFNASAANKQVLEKSQATH